MMDTIISDLGSDMKDMEYEEKTAQKDYAELMADSQETRAGDSKALTGKTAAKAETESVLMTTKEIRSATATDLKQVATVIADLHAAARSRASRTPRQSSLAQASASESRTHQLKHV